MQMRRSLRRAPGVRCSRVRVRAFPPGLRPTFSVFIRVFEGLTVCWGNSEEMKTLRTGPQHCLHRPYGPTVHS